MATRSGRRRPPRVLVRVPASSGGGTSFGPGHRWRTPGPTKGCAAPSVPRSGSSAGFERRGSARMATRSGPRRPTSGARACGGQRRRWDLRRTLTSLAAPNPDRRLRGSFGRTLGQPALEAMKAAFAEQIRIDTMTPMWLSKDQISTWRAAQVKDDVNKRRLGREASKDDEAGGAVVVPSAGAAPAPPPSKRAKMTKIKASTGR